MARKSKSKRGAADISIDLHGLILREAEDYVEKRLRQLLSQQKASFKVNIITGKGLHSGAGGAVLAREIHSFVSGRFGAYILEIEDSPHDVSIGGIPIRGHFTVKLKP